MAEALDEGEFWLPSEFLPDDFFVAEKAQAAGTKAVGGDGVCFPSELSLDYESNQSSPVESMTETESDEEYIADLTRRMAYSFLCNEGDSGDSVVFSSVNKSCRSSSPQSPLCPTGEWSSNVAPLAKASPAHATWGLLYAAAGEVARTRQQEEAEQQSVAGSAGVGGGYGLLGLPRKPTAPVSNNSSGYFADPPLSYHQMQVNQFYQLKQRQMLKQHQQQGRVVWGRQNRPGSGMDAIANTTTNRDGGGGRPHGCLSSTAWPPLQHHGNGSGMRAVFLGIPGPRKQSCGGTGVFLPRRVGNTTDSSCSTVILPARVVQALNLNLEETSAQRRLPGGFIVDHVHCLSNRSSETFVARNNAMPPRKKSSSLRAHQPASTSHREVRLPPGWTYY